MWWGVTSGIRHGRGDTSERKTSQYVSSASGGRILDRPAKSAAREYQTRIGGGVLRSGLSDDLVSPHKVW